jgi:tetratricopeptide (TPR) repeat protein
MAHAVDIRIFMIVAFSVGGCNRHDESSLTLQAVTPNQEQRSAIDAYVQAIEEFDPASADELAVMTALYKKAVEEFSQVIILKEATEDFKAKAYIWRGRVRRNQGEHALSKSDLTLALEMPNTSAELKLDATFYRGLTSDVQGRHKEAIDDYTLVIESKSASDLQRSQAILSRAYTHRDQGKAGEALADFTRVIEMPAAPEEDRVNALVQRAAFYLQQRRLKNAIEDTTFVINGKWLGDAIANQKAGALSLRAVAYMLSDQDNSREVKVLADCIEILKMESDPNVEREHIAKAYCIMQRLNPYFQENDFNEVLSDYTLILRMVPSDVDTRRRLKNKKERDRIATVFKETGRVITNKSTSPSGKASAFLARGEALCDLVRSIKPIAELTETIDKPASTPKQRMMALVGRGTLRRQDGNYEAAKKDFVAAGLIAGASSRKDRDMSIAFFQMVRLELGEDVPLSLWKAMSGSPYYPPLLQSAIDAIVKRNEESEKTKSSSN